MATKVTFNKLNLSKDAMKEVKTVNINGMEIEIKQYLPINDKLALMSNVLNHMILSEQSSGIHHSNPMEEEVVQVIEVINAYTNINFTEKQLGEDLAKTYDLLESNGVIDEIINNIPSEEYEFLSTGMDETLKAHYQYQNSIYGILDAISAQYNAMNLDVDALREKMTDEDTFKILPEVLDKLG